MPALSCKAGDPPHVVIFVLGKRGPQTRIYRAQGQGDGTGADAAIRQAAAVERQAQHAAAEHVFRLGLAVTRRIDSWIITAIRRSYFTVQCAVGPVVPRQ